MWRWCPWDQWLRIVYLPEHLLRFCLFDLTQRIIFDSIENYYDILNWNCIVFISLVVSRDSFFEPTNCQYPIDSYSEYLFCLIIIYWHDILQILFLSKCTRWWLDHLSIRGFLLCVVMNISVMLKFITMSKLFLIICVNRAEWFLLSLIWMEIFAFIDYNRINFFVACIVKQSLIFIKLDSLYWLLWHFTLDDWEHLIFIFIRLLICRLIQKVVSRN